MNNTELLNSLEAIKKSYDMDRLDDLIIKVKQDIYYENINNKQAKTVKQRTKAAMKVLKNKYNKSRPALGYTDVQKINDNYYQVFTDSYLAIALVEPLELPNIKDTSYEYPKIDRMFANVSDNEIVIDIPNMLASLKAGMLKNDNMNIYVHESGLKLDADKLKIIIDILGADDLKIYANGLKPVYFKNLKGDMALLCPIRSY